MRWERRWEDDKVWKVRYLELKINVGRKEMKIGWDQKWDQRKWDSSLDIVLVQFSLHPEDLKPIYNLIELMDKMIKLENN